MGSNHEGQTYGAVVTRDRSGRATGPDGGAAPLYGDSLLSVRTQDTSGDYSGLATPIDPLGAGPIPM